MSKIRLQAHRGVCSEYPENTMAAFRGALEQGYSIIEMDPRFTSDGRFVILHDPKVNRTCRRRDGAPVPPDSLIKELTYAQARELEAGSWMDPRFFGEPIPALEDVLGFVALNPISVKFDNVWETYPEELRQRFLMQTAASAAGAKLGFTCAHLECLEAVAKTLPQAELHWDGVNDLETLEAVAKAAQGHRLTIWVCYENEHSGWFKGAKATPELCAQVHRCGELGIWMLSNPEDLKDTIGVFHADAIETTGHIKPAMLDIQ